MVKRRRQAEELDVPEISADAAERKRVLNVLAQRRYRQRKRERLEALEKELQEKSESSSQPFADGETGVSPDSSSGSPPFSSSTVTGESICSLPPTPPDNSNAQFQNILADLFPNPELSGPSSGLICESGLLDPIPDSLFDGLEPPAESPNLDALLAVSTPVSNASATWQFISNPTNLVDGYNPDFSSQLQSHQTSTFTFPDENVLDVPTLTLLNAVLTIATRLNMTDYLWDLSGISPFFTGPRLNQPAISSPEPPSLVGLPTNFKPTPTQKLVPHHPILDILPWPSVRDKFIQVFSLPPHLRPAPAADPMGLVTLVYDLEDSAEGLRVSGSDPFSADMWEVGQLVFQRWWWAFDGKIVESSNRLRRNRGQQGLVLGAVD